MNYVEQHYDNYDLITNEDKVKVLEEITGTAALRIKIIAADGATNYMKECIDRMEDFTFDKLMEYHFTICERMELIGVSHHTLDILKKD